MLYVIPALTVGMLGYIAWLVVFRLRRDRVFTERELTRDTRASNPRERLRLLLKRSYRRPDDKPAWEDPLVLRLAEVPKPEDRAGA